MKVLVTGANGFVGLAVLQRLNVISGLQAVGSVRRGAVLTGTTVVEVGDLAAQTDWSLTLAGADAVVHLAARVHVMRDIVADPLTAFRAVNVEGTLNLARQAAAAGVKRFVFISSVKVNAESLYTSVECGRMPSSRPTIKTTGNSRPLAACMVIRVMLP